MAEQKTDVVTSKVRPQRSAGTPVSVFTFEDVKYTVKVKGEDGKKVEKSILQGINGRVESGRVLAILGPSGAGKTSLIRCFTLTAHGGVVSGRIHLDGKDLNAATLRSRCYTVEQKDNHWPFLSTRETLDYAADFYMDAPEATRRDRVSEIIKKLGLESCADTRAGTEFIQGLSGGQKRRLSIAVALVKQPDVIFLDEPTSGLDAAAAVNVMSFVDELAHTENLIIIATIHQPSSRIYTKFDQIMILSQGRTAFVGETHAAIAHFESIGHPVPRLSNPAEYFLDLVNSDFTDQQSVDAILDEWAEVEKKLPPPEEGVSKEDNSSRGIYATSLWNQISTMLRRGTLNGARDPFFFLGRCIMFLLANIFFAIIYIESRNRDQDQVINKFWICIWFIGVPANMGVVAVYAYNLENKAVSREIRNGMMAPIAYILSNTALQIPLMFAFAIFALGIPGYAIANFWGENFGEALIIYASAMWVYENFALLFGLQFENPLLGMMNYVSVWFSGFLFSGFLIPIDDIVWPFRVLAWILPFRYAVRSTVYNEIIDTTWQECAVDGDGSVCGVDEVCYGDRDNPTQRQDGADVLDALGDVFDVVGNSNTLVVDIVVCFAIGVGVKLIYAYSLYSSVGKTTHINSKVE